MTAIYTITLKNCAFFARHGVHDEEEFLGQRFFVDAELDVEQGTALLEDSINDTVHYGIAFTEIEKIITGRRRYLIEALALEVATTLCSVFSADPPGENIDSQAERARSWRARLCGSDSRAFCLTWTDIWRRLALAAISAIPPPRWHARSFFSTPGRIARWSMFRNSTVRRPGGS